MRMIFSTVRAPQLPAFTVGSLAITATPRPSTFPSPVITPSAGSSSASTFAKRPSSMNEPLSSSRSRRSRAVSLCCSRSLGRYRVPPWRAFSRSSLERSVIYPRGRRPAPSTDLWAPCGRIRASSPALLAHAPTGALAVVLVASFGCGHLDAQISRRRPQSPPLEFRLALLEERLDALARVLGLGHEQELAVQEVQRGAKVHVLLAVEGVAAEAQRDRRLASEQAGDLPHGRIELFVRDDTIDHAEGLQLGRGPAVAKHLHLEQDLARDVAGQDGLDHHRPDPDVDLRRAEVRGVDGDEHVARAGEAESAGEGVAVDPADDRLAELGHEDEQLDEQVAAAEALDSGHLTIEAGEVGAGAEDAAGAGQDDDSDLGLVAAPTEGGGEVAKHRRRKRVALVGPVEGDGGDVMSVDIEQDLLQRRLFRHGD